MNATKEAKKLIVIWTQSKNIEEVEDKILTEFHEIEGEVRGLTKEEFLEVWCEDFNTYLHESDVSYTEDELEAIVEAAHSLVSDMFDLEEYQQEEVEKQHDELGDDWIEEDLDESVKKTRQSIQEDVEGEDRASEANPDKPEEVEIPVHQYSPTDFLNDLADSIIFHGLKEIKRDKSARDWIKKSAQKIPDRTLMELIEELDANPEKLLHSNVIIQSLADDIYQILEEYIEDEVMDPFSAGDEDDLPPD